MNRGWRFDEHRDFGWSSSESPADYERIMHAAPEVLRDLLLDLGLTSLHTFIDIGCGAGELTIAAAGICARAIGVDVSPAMLDYARASAMQAGASNAEFIDGGFLTYEHSGELAHVIVTQRALHHLPDFWKAIALHRIADMLDDGGVLFLEDLVYSFAPEDAEAAVEAWIGAVAREDGTGFPRSFFEEHVREEWSTYDWIMEQMLDRAGFDIVHKQYRQQAYAAYRCVKREVTAGSR